MAHHVGNPTLNYRELHHSTGRNPPFSARSHWGKVSNFTKERARSLYERWDDAVELMRRADPDGKFHNQYLDRSVHSR